MRKSAARAAAPRRRGPRSALPASAAAHGIVGKQDLPISRALFTWAAAAGARGLLRRAGLPVAQPRGCSSRASTWWPASRSVLDPLCGVIGVAIFLLVVYAGVRGSQVATANLTPTFVYVLFWVGLPFLSLLLGDVFRAFNPWRAIARAVGFVARRFSPPEPLRLPGVARALARGARDPRLRVAGARLRQP